MAFQVFLTDDASQDLEAMHDYIAALDAPEKAGYVLDQLEKAFLSLAENPERGTYPKELLAIGLREYSEIFQAVPHHLSSHGRRFLRHGDC